MLEKNITFITKILAVWQYLGSNDVPLEGDVLFYENVPPYTEAQFSVGNSFEFVSIRTLCLSINRGPILCGIKIFLV
jgi:hypothetical protein